MDLDELSERSDVGVHISYLCVEVCGKQEILLTLLLLKVVELVEKWNSGAEEWN